MISTEAGATWWVEIWWQEAGFTEVNHWRAKRAHSATCTTSAVAEPPPPRPGVSAHSLAPPEDSAAHPDRVCSLPLKPPLSQAAPSPPSSPWQHTRTGGDRQRPHTELTRHCVHSNWLDSHNSPKERVSLTSPLCTWEDWGPRAAERQS